jgi:hypothetical protein
MGMTNCSLVGLTGKMKPVDDVTMKIDYYNVSLNKGFTDGTAINFKGYSGANTYYMEGYKRHLGQEVDATLTYDYTEDVQLSLLGGIFVPGSAFKKATTTTSVSDDSTGGMSVATEVIGSMKVTF